MYQKIMVPLDGSELAECVLPHVESLAKSSPAGKVILIRAVEPFHMPMGEGATAFSDEDLKRIHAEDVQRAENYLKEVAGRASFGGAEVETVVINSGRVADGLAEYATKNGVDIIVLATHGRSGISRWVWGSVADRILRSACVPVVMVRAPGCVPGI